MKKNVFYSTSVAISLSWLLQPAYAGNNDNLLLTIPSIIATARSPSPPPNNTEKIIVCKGKEWTSTPSQKGYCNVGDQWGSCDYDVQQYCQDLTYGGYTDWYLPTKTDLQNLASCSNQAIKIPEGIFWSSTKDGWGFSPHYWIVSLPSGEVPFGGEFSTSYGVKLSALCLRY